MNFFVDECLSPSLVRYLNGLGYDAVHPRDLGRLGETDRAIFARAIDEDRIVVTENASDFRDLAAAVDIHAGLIILPSVERSKAQALMGLVVADLLARGGSRPADAIVNTALIIDEDGAIEIHPLP